MKKALLVAVLCAGLLVGVVGMSGPAWAVAYLQNAQFEGGFTGTVAGNRAATGWTEFGGANCDPDTGTVHTPGGSCQKIQYSSAGGIYQTFDATSGQTYAVSVWAKVTTNGTHRGELGVDPTGGTDPAGANVVWVSSTSNAWTRLTLTGTATATNQVTVFLRVAIAGTCRFDDAYVQTTTCTGDAAACISNTIPDFLNPGQVVNGVTVTMKNTGTNVWTDGGGEYKDYNFGQTDGSPAPGMASRANVGGYINPDQQKVFSMNITAPAAPGVYDTNWRMVREGDCWFGDTLVKRILVQSGSAPVAYNGPHSLPGAIQAEDYDYGGQNVAYYDSTEPNEGGQYRANMVDVETCADTGDGYDVGFMTTSEWLTYSVTVSTGGTYDLNMRVAAPSAGGQFRIDVDGVTGTVTDVPSTGGSQVWQTVAGPSVSLTAGSHVLKVNVIAGGWSFNYLDAALGVETIPPTVESISRAGGSPTGASSVQYTVTFSEPVTGVDTTDFSLDVSGVSGASVAGVSADAGATRTVTVNTGSGDGTIRLDVNDADTLIKDLANNPISTGYHTGEVYTIEKTPPADVTSFTAIPAGGQVTLSWTNPSDADFAGTMIRCRADGADPADPTDGTLVVDRPGAPGAGDSYVHTGLANCTNYRYKAFAYDSSLNYASGAIADATPSGPAVISNSTFDSDADGWSIATWRSSTDYGFGAMEWASPAGNPGGCMQSAGSGATQNDDHCNREGGEIQKVVSTLGCPGYAIKVSYDLRVSALGADYTGAGFGGCPVDHDLIDEQLTVFYSTDGGSTWIEADWLTRQGLLDYQSYGTRTIDLTAVPACNNNPNFALKFRWQFNNDSASGDTGWLDNIKVESFIPTPVPSLSCTSGQPTGTWTTNPAFEFAFSSDGATQYEYKWDADPTASGSGTAATSPYSLDSGSVGGYYFHVRAGNGSGWSDYADIGPYNVDAQAPTGGVTILGGECTRNTAVTLGLSASDNLSGVALMQFSSDGSSWIDPEAFAASRDWTLPIGDGTKTVYARFIDTAGNVSGAYTDTIGLDTTPPTVDSATAAPSLVATEDVTIAASATDSGCGGGAITWEHSVGGAEGSYKPGLTVDNDDLAEGENTLYVIATDGVGNASDAVQVTTTVTKDTSPATVTDVTSTTANGTYGLDATISIQVTFSEPVIISDLGAIDLQLETGDPDRVAIYTGGNGTFTTLAFEYTVQSGDSTPDLDYRDINSLKLIGDVTIKDAAGIQADLVLPAPGETGSLGANKDIAIDTSLPGVVVARQTPPEGSTTSSSVVWRALFSEAVRNVDESDFAVTVLSGGITGCSVTSVTPVDAQTYDVAVNTGSGSGVIRLDIAASSDIENLVGNDLPLPYESGETYTIDRTGPGAITSFTATPGDREITLTWHNPSDPDFASTMIRYKLDGYPTGPTDGAMLLNRPSLPNTDDSMVHTGLAGGTIYYYSAFAYDNLNNVGNKADAGATPTGPCFVEPFSYPNGYLNGQGGWVGTQGTQIWVENGIARIAGTSATAMDAVRSLFCPGIDGIITVRADVKMGAGSGTTTLWHLRIDDPAGVPLGQWTGKWNTAAPDGGAQRPLATEWSSLYMVMDTAERTTSYYFNGIPVMVRPFLPGAAPVVGSVWLKKYANATGSVFFDNITIGGEVPQPPPTGTVTINDGAPRTNSPDVMLEISSGPGVTQVQLSDDTNNWTDWEAVASMRPYTLPAGDGTKSVYARFRNASGAVSDTASDSIILDAAPPSFAGISATPSLAKLGAAVTITFTASEGLQAIPTVTVNGSAGTYAGNDMGLAYTYIYAVQATDPDGPASIVVSGTDLAGSPGSSTSTTALTIDSTPPTIDISAVKQNGIDLLGGIHAVQGTGEDAVVISVTADETPTVTVTPNGGSPEAAEAVSATTFDFTWSVTATTPNGDAEITATATDAAGNSATETATIQVNKNQIEGDVSLDTLVDRAPAEPYEFDRDVLFRASGDGIVPVEWTLKLHFINDNATKVAGASYRLVDVPDGLAWLSAKTAWSLCRGLGITLGESGQATGVDFLLKGGDLDNSNSINILDYVKLKTRWYSSDPAAITLADINGDGDVSLPDYSIMKLYWFVVGDPR